jgi:hypothetical protein
VDKNDTKSLLEILSYNEIREHEEMEAENEKFKAMMAIVMGSKLKF